MTKIVKISGISQSGVKPYEMTCMSCFEKWTPASTTDHGLDKSAKDHWARCPVSATTEESTDE
jgi:formate-dependent nitrite reductase cytochrome c552 subunit